METQTLLTNNISGTKIKFEDGQIFEAKNVINRGDKILEIHFDSGTNTYENLHQIAIFTSHWEHFVLIDNDSKEYNYYSFTFFQSLDYSPVKKEFVLTMVKMDDTELENLELRNNIAKLEEAKNNLEKENNNLKTFVNNAQIENTQLKQILVKANEQLNLKQIELEQEKLKNQINTKEEVEKEKKNNIESKQEAK